MYTTDDMESMEKSFKDRQRIWIDDVHQFLLSDMDRMAAWIAFCNEQRAKRAQGVDTSKPDTMVEIQPNVFTAK